MQDSPQSSTLYNGRIGLNRLIGDRHPYCQPTPPQISARGADTLLQHQTSFGAYRIYKLGNASIPTERASLACRPVSSHPVFFGHAHDLFGRETPVATRRHCCTYLALSTSTGSSVTSPNEEFPAPEQSVGTTQENQSFGTTQKDPLVDQGLQNWQYIGIVTLAVGAIAIVGFFSRRIEYALLFALVLSVVLIVFFLTV